MLTIKTPEGRHNEVLVSLLLTLLTDFIPSSSVFIVNFQQVYGCWEITTKIVFITAKYYWFG